MNERSFNEMFLGNFEFTGTDYPELKSTVNFRGIYHHECRDCGRGFYGYKRRVTCFDCNELFLKRKQLNSSMFHFGNNHF